MAYYQCFKVRSTRQEYVSSYQVKNHTEGAAWVAKAVTHYKIKGNDMMKPTESPTQPAKAIKYP